MANSRNPNSSQPLIDSDLALVFRQGLITLTRVGDRVAMVFSTELCIEGINKRIAEFKHYILKLLKAAGVVCVDDHNTIILNIKFLPLMMGVLMGVITATVVRSCVLPIVSTWTPSLILSALNWLGDSSPWSDLVTYLLSASASCFTYKFAVASIDNAIHVAKQPLQDCINDLELKLVDAKHEMDKSDQLLADYEKQLDSARNNKNIDAQVIRDLKEKIGRLESEKTNLSREISRLNSQLNAKAQGVRTNPHNNRVSAASPSAAAATPVSAATPRSPVAPAHAAAAPISRSDIPSPSSILVARAAAAALDRSTTPIINAAAAEIVTTTPASAAMPVSAAMPRSPVAPSVNTAVGTQVSAAMPTSAAASASMVTPASTVTPVATNPSILFSMPPSTDNNLNRPTTAARVFKK